MRLRLDLAYEGTEFFGWAIQPKIRTVQGDLEAALSLVLREPIQVTCAGRTDAGVHARGQVVHFDVSSAALNAAAGRTRYEPTAVLARRLNGLLKKDAHVLRCQEAAQGFDARYSALWRRYSYRVVDDPAVADPLTRRHVLAWGRPLDVDAMNEAAKHLVGMNDFASFCRKRPNATTIRTLLDLSWERDPNEVLVATVRADAFCHQMVRSLIGCLIAVGDGRYDVEWPAQMLTARVRDPLVKVLPPHGLTLEEVAYPDDAELAAQAEAARTKRTLG